MNVNCKKILVSVTHSPFLILQQAGGLGRAPPAIPERHKQCILLDTSLDLVLHSHAYRHDAKFVHLHNSELGGGGGGSGVLISTVLHVAIC